MLTLCVLRRGETRLSAHWNNVNWWSSAGSWRLSIWSWRSIYFSFILYSIDRTKERITPITPRRISYCGLYRVWQIWNKHFFTSLDDVEFSWALYADGSLIGSGPLDLPILGPREKHLIPSESEPWYKLWKSSSGHELFLTITGRLSSTNSWADKGHFVASQQLSLPPALPRHVKVLVESYDKFGKFPITLFCSNLKMLWLT